LSDRKTNVRLIITYISTNLKFGEDQSGRFGEGVR